MYISTPPIRKIAKLESNIGDAALDQKEVQGQFSQRFLVRIKSTRKRLLDEDNLCGKYHIDLLRYAGVIPNDTPDQIKVEISQKKSGKGQAEETIIEVYDSRS